MKKYLIFIVDIKKEFVNTANSLKNLFTILPF